MVEGLRQLGMAVAMTVIPALNARLVEDYGWRGAYRIFGVGIWLIFFPAIYFLFHNRPADLGQKIDGGSKPDGSPTATESDVDVHYWGLTLVETLRTGSFWIAAGGTAAFSLIHTAVFFCIVPIFHERGLSANDAAEALMVFAAFLAVMQVVGGVLADRIHAAYLMCFGLAMLSLAIVSLIVTTDRTSAWISGGIFGISQGIYFGATNPLWARYFGLMNLGKIRGVLITINVASSSIGPLFAGMTRDLSGSFHFALLVFAVAPAPIALLSLFTAPPQRESPSFAAE